MKWINSKKRIFGALIIIFLATFGVGSVLGGQFKSLFSDSISEQDEKGKVINILFMGIDARDAKSNSRSDTMILASIDSKTKKVAMVSIPRDTHIKNALGHSEKINSVNYIKGPEAACKEVAKLLDTKVDYYVVTNFAGFGDIVDTLGGVDINVETDMVHKDVSYSIYLSKGYQHLNGDQALQYVRYRGGPTADIGRTQRQQKFIKALASQMFKAKTVLKLPKLLPQLSKCVHTNIPMTDMVYLANMAKKIDTSQIAAQTLPGYPYTDPGSGASYWEADKTKAKILISSLLEGKTFPVVGDPPSWIQKERNKYKPVDLPTAETLEKLEPVPATEPETIDDGTQTPSELPGDNSNTEPGQIVPGGQDSTNTDSGTNPNPGTNPDPGTNPAPGTIPDPGTINGGQSVPPVNSDGSSGTVNNNNVQTSPIVNN